MLHKKMIIIILTSSAIAIPVTAAVIAAIRKQRPRPPQGITSLTHTNPKENARNIAVAPSTTSQQQKEERLEQWQQDSQQNSETIEEVTNITTVATTAISNNQTNDGGEDITSPVALAVAPSSLDHSHINTTMTLSSSSSSSPTSKKEKNKKEISVSDESKKARESLKEQIIEAIKEAKESAKGTAEPLKEESIGVSATVDSRDSQILEKHIETLMRLFEMTMTEIRKEPYDKQIKLLESYRDLLQRQNKVVNARKKMASKLKAGS